MKKDIENAADAKMPGDAVEDAADMKPAKKGNALTRAMKKKPKKGM